MLKVEELSKSIAESENLAGAFNWQAILELVMTLLGGNCFASKSSLKDYKKAITSPGDAGVIKKIAALVVIKRELGVRRAEAIKVRDEMFATIDVLSDQELDQVYSEVVAETMPPRFVI